DALTITSTVNTSSPNSNATAISGAISNAAGITFNGAGNNSITLGGGVTSGAGGITVSGSYTVNVTGNNTYTGATTVTSGTLALGNNNRIADASNLVMAGGTFSTGGFSETLGTLSLLTASSIIDLGAGASALVFSESSGVAWDSSIGLSFVNFTAGQDSIKIGVNSNGLTVTQLGQITINGQAATIDGSGFLNIAPIPEPSTYAAFAGVLALGLVAVRRQRRGAGAA
ncbi:MAG: PEP-CTERM sorting domain-containing protein, partial [Rariglobus sp.]